MFWPVLLLVAYSFVVCCNDILYITYYLIYIYSYTYSWIFGGCVCAPLWFQLHCTHRHVIFEKVRCPFAQCLFSHVNACNHVSFVCIICSINVISVWIVIERIYLDFERYNSKSQISDHFEITYRFSNLSINLKHKNDISWRETKVSWQPCAWVDLHIRCCRPHMSEYERPVSNLN